MSSIERYNCKSITKQRITKSNISNSKKLGKYFELKSSNKAIRNVIEKTLPIVNHTKNDREHRKIEEKEFLNKNTAITKQIGYNKNNAYRNSQCIDTSLALPTLSRTMANNCKSSSGRKRSSNSDDKKRGPIRHDKTLNSHVKIDLESIGDRSNNNIDESSQNISLGSRKSFLDASMSYAKFNRNPTYMDSLSKYLRCFKERCLKNSLKIYSQSSKNLIDLENHTMTPVDDCSSDILSNNRTKDYSHFENNNSNGFENWQTTNKQTNWYNNEEGIDSNCDIRSKEIGDDDDLCWIDYIDEKNCSNLGDNSIEIERWHEEGAVECNDLLTPVEADEQNIEFEFIHTSQ
ncbi:MAG: hypothetical protein MHMPM18_001962 [Marteilia pararefringens]